MSWLWRAALLLLLLTALGTAQTSWEEKNRSGEKAFQEGRLVDANRLFTEAYQQAQQFGPKGLRLSPILNNLALVAFVQNNYIASEKIYQNAITIIEGARGKEDPLLLPVLDNLARLYVKQWAFDQAIEVSERADKIREKKLGLENPETVLGMNRLATLYLDNVRLLPHVPADLNDDHPANATALNAMGQQEDARKLAMAEGLYWKVLNAEEKTYGPENGRLVDVLQSLGEVLRAEGNRLQAGQSYARALSILEKTLSPDSVKLLAPLQQLAELRADEGNYPEAETFYQRALRIGEAKKGPTDPSLLSVLTGYAAVLEKLQRPEEAKRLAERAAALPHPQTAAVVPVGETASVPYVLRFERFVSDRYTGTRHTCMLVRADGRFRFEDQQREGGGASATATSLQRSADGMGDDAAPQESVNDRGVHSTSAKIFDGSVDGPTLQQLRAILSAKEVRSIQGSFPAKGAQNYYGSERVMASVLREDSVQNFSFPDVPARAPYENALKPLFKWVGSAEKQKGDAVSGGTLNNCSPDEAKGVPMQFTAARPRPWLVQPSATEVATNTVPAPAAAAPPPDKTPTFKVDVNLVLVRVVARDSQGRAIGTLKQEDFRLLDNRRPQTITRFSREQAALQTAAPTSARPETTAGAGGGPPDDNGRAAAAPERSVVYLFDDLHLSATDLEKVRGAADHQMSALPAEVRGAIFTTSGETALDFTPDRAKLQQTLAAIRARSVGGSSGNDCPHMDPYLADLIWNKHDEEALGAATGDALICAYGNDVRFAHAAEANARSAAQQMIGAAEVQSRTFLVALQNALRHLAAAPGQRTLVLVSPGFVAPGREQDFAKLMDGALRSDIIVSTLDIRGLVQLNSVASDNGAAAAYLRESSEAASDLLQSMADITGGTFFHNSNDLDDGFRRTAATPEYSYVLGFSPTSDELDGRFHTLTVALNGNATVTLQARKGYFARKP